MVWGSVWLSVKWEQIPGNQLALSELNSQVATSPQASGLHGSFRGSFQ